MNATVFLRIASVLSLIHCILHTIGGVLASPRHGAEEALVIDTMKSRRFDVMGSARSYWDFFFGYGLFITIILLVLAIFFWQLSGLAKGNPAWIKPVLAVFCFNFLAMAVVSWKYFFIAPAATELLIAICLGLAFASVRAPA